MLQCVEASACQDDPQLIDLTLVTKDGEHKQFTLSKSAASSLVKSIQRVNVKEHSYLSKLYDDKGAAIVDGSLVYYEIYNYPTRKTRMKKTIKIKNVENKLRDLPMSIIKVIADCEDDEWAPIVEKAKLLLNVESINDSPPETEQKEQQQCLDKNYYKKLSKLLKTGDKSESRQYGIILPKIEVDKDGEDVLCLDDDDKPQKLTDVIDI